MANPYQRTSFLTSVPNAKLAPADTGAEVAFAGRSNAGKSSALNAITQQRSLARISKSPGRTRALNFFRVTDNRRLVDLPGYGYARVSQQLKQEWQKHLTKYLETRHSLQGLILLMDIRHPLTDYDQQMLQWCQHAGLPTHILLTKCDKLKRGPGNAALMKVRKSLRGMHHDASIQLFSALNLTGVEEAREILDKWLEL